MAWTMWSGMQVVRRERFWIDAIGRTNMLDMGCGRRGQEESQGI